MEYRIETRETFRIVGKPLRVTMAGGAGDLEDKASISRFWEAAMKDGSLEAIGRLMKQGAGLGVMGACIPSEDPRSAAFTYLIAVEVEAGQAGFPEGWIDLTIPASNWAVFPCRGPIPESIQSTWPRIMAEWFPTSGYERVPAPDLEVYPAEDPAHPEIHAEIWVPIGKK
ncbi:MAG: GyrI-like domain-containing protein [Spirochaetota bacterium]